MRREVAAAIVLALGGCDYALRLDHVSLDDAGKSDDGAAPLCSIAKRAIDDSFPTTAPCSWGEHYTTGPATLTSGSGHLRIVPTSDGGNGGCDTPPEPFAAGGVVAQVTQAIGGDESYTSLQLNSTTDVTITISGDALWFEDGNASNRWAHITYTSPAEMGWMRLRPSPDAIVAEYSKDGKDWLLLGTHATVVPNSVVVSLAAGVNLAAPNFNGIAEFSRFIVCGD